MRANKRDLLLETAERLFYREGFHATGVDRVVTEAGVARMTLYNHFPSKEALVAAVLERRYHRYLAAAQRAVECRGAATAMAALTEFHCQWLHSVSDRGCIVVKAIGEFEQHRPEIADQGRRLKRDLLAVIRDALEIDGHGADAALAERVLIAFEGADALAPVLGTAAAAAHLRAIVPAVLKRDAGVRV